MKKNKIVKGLSLISLVVFCGAGIAEPLQSTASLNSEVAGDPIASQNPHYKGLKSGHSSRKEAAKRLKVNHQLQRQQEAENSVATHQGQTPSTQGGAQ